MNFFWGGSLVSLVESIFFWLCLP